MTKLVDLKVNEFIEVLGSDAPAPGGGSAAALSGSIGISLTKMVAELTIGKKKYAEFEELNKEILAESIQLQKELLDAIDKDTEAFNVVSAVFDMPKETDEDKAKRRQAMQEALKGATATPFEAMEIIVKAIRVTHKAVGKSNTNAASDLGVAATSLKTALQGSWLNVLINLAGVKDEAFVAEYKEAGEKLLAEGSKLADEVYNEIEASL